MLEQSAEQVTEIESDIGRWMRLVQKKASCDEVDREMLESLVEKIVIGDNGNGDRNKQQDIHIYYRFVGSLSSMRDFGLIPQRYIE